MHVNESEQVICVDIDDTVVVWGNIRDVDPLTHRIAQINDPYTGKQVVLRVHEPHLKIVESRLARGATLIVWSASGYQWAKAVLEALGLDNKNIHVFSKPIAYVDDKKANEWMGEHIYLHPDSSYGKS